MLGRFPHLQVAHLHQLSIVADVSDQLLLAAASARAVREEPVPGRPQSRQLRLGRVRPRLGRHLLLHQSFDVGGRVPPPPLGHEHLGDLRHVGVAVPRGGNCGPGGPGGRPAAALFLPLPGLDCARCSCGRCGIRIFNVFQVHRALEQVGGGGDVCVSAGAGGGGGLFLLGTTAFGFRGGCPPPSPARRLLRGAGAGPFLAWWGRFLPVHYYSVGRKFKTATARRRRRQWQGQRRTTVF